MLEDACGLVCASVWRWDWLQVFFAVTYKLSLLCSESGPVAVTWDWPFMLVWLVSRRNPPAFTSPALRSQACAPTLPLKSSQPITSGSELSLLRPSSVPQASFYFETDHWVAQPGLGFTLLLRQNLGSPASASQVAGVAGLHHQTGHIWVSVGLVGRVVGGHWNSLFLLVLFPPRSH